MFIDGHLADTFPLSHLLIGEVLPVMKQEHAAVGFGKLGLDATVDFFQLGFHAFRRAKVGLQVEEVEYVELMTVEEILNRQQEFTADSIVALRHWLERRKAT